MPKKLLFRVVYATSQDDIFPAIELNKHSPSTRGWQSSRNSLYPQKIVFGLEGRSRIRKIQILSHQNHIASKIEFFVGDSPGDKFKNVQDAKYSRLGYVIMSDNVKTEYRARELKSVHVDAIGTCLQMVLHKNYPNLHNYYNQVGVTAINFIGDLLDKNSTTQPINSDYISPFEDLAFDMYQDPEIAGIMKRLELQKQSAVKEEQFDQAKRLRDAVSSLKKVCGSVAAALVKGLALQTKIECGTELGGYDPRG